VQDIFQNETGEYADVILPAGSFAEKDGTFTNSDRRVQLVRKALPLPGQARPDWEILCDLAKRIETRLGRERFTGFDYTGPSAIWDEMAQLTPPFQGITYQRLEAESGIHWPCFSADDPGTPYLFADSFPRGLGKFSPLEYSPSAELPDADYPYILSTGRVLYHWHGGTMTRRSRLEQIYPEPTVEVNPGDAQSLGIQDQSWVNVRSRRGQIQVKAVLTERSPQGTVFIPFHFAEAAANELTIDARDPLAKIPDYKVCAVALEP
jgi:predicted molibdopterin-dependent oxidoreductase YjgC